MWRFTNSGAHCSNQTQTFMSMAEKRIVCCAAAFLPPFEDHFELMRIPQEICPALEANLKVQENFVVAWLQAVCTTFPGRNLIDLMDSEARLFPAFLVTREMSAPIQVCSPRLTWDVKHPCYTVLGVHL
jgi:hypothetical protein